MLRCWNYQYRCSGSCICLAYSIQEPLAFVRHRSLLTVNAAIQEAPWNSPEAVEADLYEFWLGFHLSYSYSNDYVHLYMLFLFCLDFEQPMELEPFPLVISGTVWSVHPTLFRPMIVISNGFVESGSVAYISHRPTLPIAKD